MRPVGEARPALSPPVVFLASPSPTQPAGQLSVEVHGSEFGDAKLKVHSASQDGP